MLCTGPTTKTGALPDRAVPRCPGCRTRLLSGVRKDVHGALPLPGIGSATDLQLARSAGLAFVKVFPAAVLGGPAFLRALAGPFPDVAVMPSGGVTRDDVAAYRAVPSVVAVGASWITPPALLEAGDWDAVTALARDAAALVGPDRTAALPA